MTRAKHIINRLDEFSNPSEERVTLRFGNDSSRKAVLTLLKTIQALSMEGSSRTIRHDVDGDGAYSFKVKGDVLKEVDAPSDDEIGSGKDIWIPGID